ncbi:arsenate reductase [Halanaerobium saccharolyticum]|uniref:Arsenate reductase n=1 Tax=Halanaerobium saccharolyticum TaxID=43595 RepID=A0A4R7Z823_9FIRM|nr:arsenate reductase ArsC [Halanaerobium saccharolyticum]RAK04210.1 arsenate reductase [Halanaerobium saccharolyticum]TDW06767.1 arsenate reductase [Halanaerobium saccharolyticum]TDX62402.1 arsenate reductase [Halanaerobium saccharolyticum]
MKYKVAFVCVGNSCRSQMAEGFAREYAGDILDVYSAGTDPAPEVKPNAVKAMDEVEINISDQYPKLLADIPSELDVLITMGCGVECPFIPCKFREDWGLDDPAGEPMEMFRETREIIDTKVKQLIEKIKNDKI